MTGDGQAVCDQLRVAIVRTGWSATARLTGIDRTVLHRAFPDPRRIGRRARVPSFMTLALVADALGFRLVVTERPND